MNFQMFKLDLEKAEQPEIKLPTSVGSQKKQESSRKTATAFVCVDHNKLWKILKEMGMPDHFTCLMRNLYACQEATVRTRLGTMDWFRIGQRSMSRLYIITPLVSLICRVHHVKCWAGGSKSWNLDCWKKYQ